MDDYNHNSNYNKHTHNYFYIKTVYNKRYSYLLASKH